MHPFTMLHQAMLSLAPAEDLLARRPSLILLLLSALLFSAASLVDRLTRRPSAAPPRRPVITAQVDQVKQEERSL